MLVPNIAYRYRDVLYAAPLDEYEYPIGSPRVDVVLDSYKILKHTPKGFWIQIYEGKKRFVLNDSVKKYAHNSIGEAKKSFIARKNTQLRIYSNRIMNIKKALQIINGNKDEFRY